MRIAVSAGQPGRLARPAAVSAVAKAAEQLGYSTVWVRDGAALDPIVVLSTVAASTTRVRLGVGFDVARSAVAGSAGQGPARPSTSSATDACLSHSVPTELLDETLDVLESTWSDCWRRPARLQRPRPPLLLVANTRRSSTGWPAGPTAGIPTASGRLSHLHVGRGPRPGRRP